jgi:hypothetical protein
MPPLPMATCGSREHFGVQPKASTSSLEHATWRYLRFTLSYRDVKELLAERGRNISCERCGAGPSIVRRLRQRRRRPTDPGIPTTW